MVLMDTNNESIQGVKRGSHMLSLFGKKENKKSKKQIEILMNDLKLYLENNYKDLAIETRKEAISLVEIAYKQGEINEKSYRSYKQVLNEYSKKMENYNHQQFYRS